MFEKLSRWWRNWGKDAFITLCAIIVLLVVIFYTLKQVSVCLETTGLPFCQIVSRGK